MEYTATAKYLRVSTRKLRLIADSIRRKRVLSVMSILPLTPKRSASVIGSVIASAVANARQKGVQEANLVISRLEIMGGPVMKRWHAASRGMAHPYKKRMTHVRVVLSDQVVTKGEK